MSIEKIKIHLICNISINFIKIDDDSKSHNYKKTGITHLKIIIVSNDFKYQTTINRHRKIFSILKKNIKYKIYSITLYTYTPVEWNVKKNKKMTYSKCIKR